MDLDKQMLGTPKNLFNRLTPLVGKKFKGGFKEIVSKLRRPYYRLSETDYKTIQTLAGDSDVLMFDGKVQVTFGNADGGFALMPLDQHI